MKYLKYNRTIICCPSEIHQGYIQCSNEINGLDCGSSQGDESCQCSRIEEKHMNPSHRCRHWTALQAWVIGLGDGSWRIINLIYIDSMFQNVCKIEGQQVKMIHKSYSKKSEMKIEGNESHGIPRTRCSVRYWKTSTR